MAIETAREDDAFYAAIKAIHDPVADPEVLKREHIEKMAKMMKNQKIETLRVLVSEGTWDDLLGPDVERRLAELTDDA
jgi:hypothetical protein